MGRFVALFGRPAFLRAFHAWLTVLWFALIFVSIFTALKDAIWWVVLMSAWANFAGHFSSWQAARVETQQDTLIKEVAEGSGGDS